MPRYGSYMRLAHVTKNTRLVFGNEIGPKNWIKED